MKDLYELVSLLERRDIPTVKTLRKQGQSRLKSRYTLLFEAIADRKIKSNEELAEFLGVELNSKKFRYYTNQFQVRLINSLIFSRDKSENEKYLESRSYLNIILTSIKNSYTTGVNNYFLKKLNKILNISLKKEYTNLAFETVLLLKTRTSVSPSHKKQFLEYVKIYENILVKRNSELLSIHFYELFISQMNTKKGVLTENLNFLKTSLAQLDQVPEDYRTRIFKLNYNTLKLYYLNATNNHNDLIDFAENYVNSLPNNIPISYSRKYMFQLNIAVSKMMLGNFNSARETINEIISEIPLGRLFWFKVKEIEVTNELYSVSYLDAWKTTNYILSHKNFNVINKIDQETWKSFHAYLCFLIRAGAFEVSNRERGEANQLKVAVLQQEMPLYNKDKRGANISLLILQILFDLLDKDTELVVNRIEALRKYKQRNLDTEHEHYRTDCFIRMLEMVVKHHFNHKKVLERTPKWLDKLKEKPRDFSSQHYEVEILPYETLWEWVLKLTKAVWA